MTYINVQFTIDSSLFLAFSLYKVINEARSVHFWTRKLLKMLINV
jgi:hypothetical protein